MSTIKTLSEAEARRLLAAVPELHHVPARLADERVNAPPRHVEAIGPHGAVYRRVPHGYLLMIDGERRGMFKSGKLAVAKLAEATRHHHRTPAA